MSGSRDRALNFAMRVTGGEEVKAAMQGVASAARATLSPLAEASKAAVQHETAVMRAAGAADALGAAQAGVARDLAAAKAALKAGTMDHAAYESAVLKAKQATALARAEYRATTAELDRTAAALVATRGAAAGIAAPLQQGARGSREARAGMQQLGFQINDVAVQYAAGTSAMQIFAQQSGQVISAVGMMTSGKGRLAQVLTGPWGLAMVTGASLLAAFGSRMGDSNKETDKAAKAHQTLADRLDRSKNSYDEVIAAVREYNGQAAKSREVTLENAAAVAKAAAENIKLALATREKLAAELAAANATARGSAGQGFGGATSLNLGRAAGIEAQIRENDQRLKALERDARGAVVNVAEELSRLATDPQYAIEQRFVKLRKEARESIKDVKALTARLADLNRQEKAAQAALKPERGGGGASSGAQASVGDMVALIKDLFPGARITSTTGGKHVKGSDHYAGRAIDFVPAGGIGSIPTEEVYRRLKEAGVDIRRNAGGKEQFFGPGRPAAKPGDHDRHFHVAWQGSAPDPDRVRERLAREAEKAQEEAARRARQREQLFAALDLELLDAKRAGVTDAEQLAGFARKRVQAEAKTLADDLAERVRRGDLTQAEADLAIAKGEEVRLARLANIDRQKQHQLRAEALQADMAAIDLQRDALSLLGGMATTQAERREVQLALLALDEREERARLNAVIASEEASKTEREIARRRLDALSGLMAQRREAVRQQTAGPGERFSREINLTPGEINEAIEQVKVNGLNALNDGLVDAIVNFRSLGDVGRSVLRGVTTDLVNLAVQKHITAPLADLLGLGGDRKKGVGAALGLAGGESGGKSVLEDLGLGGVDMASVKASAAITAMTLAAQQFAASMAMTPGAAAGGGGGGLLGAIFGIAGAAVGGNPLGKLVPDVNATFAANPGLFASGTDRVPTGKPFWVGENGRELMERTPAGQLRVYSNQQAPRRLAEGGGGPPVVYAPTFNIPKGADPRKTQSTISRGTQQGLARATRKNLAAPAGRV